MCVQSPHHYCSMSARVLQLAPLRSSSSQAVGLTSHSSPFRSSNSSCIHDRTAESWHHANAAQCTRHSVAIPSRRAAHTSVSVRMSSQ